VCWPRVRGRKHKANPFSSRNADDSALRLSQGGNAGINERFDGLDFKARQHRTHRSPPQIVSCVTRFLTAISVISPIVCAGTLH